MTTRRYLIAAVATLAMLIAACSSSGAGGRKVAITQQDDGCTPASIAASPGEKLDLVIKNDSGHDPYEVEGIEGTQFEEIAVPEGKTRSAGYNVPGGAGTHKLKCYVPGGVSTIIEVVASGAAASTEPAATGEDTPEAGTPEAPDTTVAVTLTEYTVTPDKTSVAAGNVRFIATNTSASQVHELAVLKVNDDDSLDNLGEVEDIDPGSGGSVTLELEPGTYQLACLIAPGQEGSTVDHYQQGMYTDFTVTEAR